jgi:hypothetical protein
MGSGGLFGMGGNHAPHSVGNSVGNSKSNMGVYLNINSQGGRGYVSPAPSPAPTPTMSAGLRSAIDALVFSHGVGEPNASPLIAYRAWGIVAGRLTSVGVGPVAWPTRRIFEAVCQASATYSYGIRDDSGHHLAHNAPHQGCSCGIYGFATPATLEQVMESAVLGRVSLGGEVVVCADPGSDVILGYRAQCAYPSLLYLWETDNSADNRVNGPAAANDRIRALAAAYGVETAPLPPQLLQRIAARQTAVTTRTAYAAQSALLSQMYAQQWQQSVGQAGLGQPTAPPQSAYAPSPTNPLISGSAPTVSQLTQLQHSYPNATAMGLLLPGGGGPGPGPTSGILEMIAKAVGIDPAMGATTKKNGG